MAEESCCSRLEFEEISPEDETPSTIKRRRVEELGEESNDVELDVIQPTQAEEKTKAAMKSRSKHIQSKPFLSGASIPPEAMVHSHCFRFPHFDIF